MKLSVATAAAVVAVAASPVFAEKEFCGLWNSTETNDYTIYNNLWGAHDDPAGGQCTGLDSVDGSTVAWHTSFNWNGTSWQVKSFANAALKFEPVQLANITSIPSMMEYDYKYDGKIITNVAYDLFTSASAGGQVEYELMVWLAALGGAWPLTTTGKPIKAVKVGNVDFNLYQGRNGNTTVFSYVAVNTTTSFSADFKDFFDELPANNTIAPTQFLTHVQAGTEPFQGQNATLTVSKYSAAVNTA
jgi:xyloglucan-specific endo-beta-1,4-glucanase